GSSASMKCPRLLEAMMPAVRSKNNPSHARNRYTGGVGANEGFPRYPNADAACVATFQRQTYVPFTSTRAQPATPAPTTAPPTTARRVVRRATPATLTGVNGRPTLACALSTATEGISPGDQLIDASVPKTRVAVANNACLTRIFLIATSCAELSN